MYISSETVKDYNGIREKITTSNMPSTDEMKEYISSFSKKYEHKLGIYNDELVYYMPDEDENVSNKVTENEQKWLEDLGIKERVIETSEELFEWGSDDPNNQAYHTLVKYNGTEEKVTVPKRCYIVGNGAFKYNSVMKKVKLQEGVKLLSKDAFYSCRNLEYVKLPDGIETIGGWAFMYCYKLNEINLPDSITSIGERAFHCCEKIQSVVIPNSIRAIYTCTFFGCKSLKSVTFPDNLFGIHEQAFDNCTSLKSIELPDSVGYLGRMAFKNSGLESVYLSKYCVNLDDCVFGACQNLENIYIDSENPSITSVDGVLYTKDKETLIQYPAGKKAETYTVLNGTKKIANDAFYECKNLIKVVLPNSLEEIGNYCFSQNENLLRIKIPGKVIKIGDWAFGTCYKLEIDCEVESKPNGWHNSWNPLNRPVNWGVTN